jgi:hypothetical protein
MSLSAVYSKEKIFRVSGPLVNPKIPISSAGLIRGSEAPDLRKKIGFNFHDVGIPPHRFTLHGMSMTRWSCNLNTSQTVTALERRC